LFKSNIIYLFRGLVLYVANVCYEVQPVGDYAVI